MIYLLTNGHSGEGLFIVVNFAAFLLWFIVGCFFWYKLYHHLKQTGIAKKTLADRVVEVAV
jgi:hypothetical protein